MKNNLFKRASFQLALFIALLSLAGLSYGKPVEKQEALEFVKTAVTLAMHRDNSSGGVIRTMDITKDGYTRDIIKFNDLKYPAAI